MKQIHIDCYDTVHVKTPSVENCQHDEMLGLVDNDGIFMAELTDPRAADVKDGYIAVNEELMYDPRINSIILLASGTRTLQADRRSILRYGLSIVDDTDPQKSVRQLYVPVRIFADHGQS